MNSLSEEEVDDPQPIDKATSKRRRSAIWDFFVENTGADKGSAKCNTCKKSLKTPNGTTGTLIKHLSTHFTDYCKYTKLNEGKVKAVEQQKKKAKTESGTSQTLLTTTWAKMPEHFKSTLTLRIAEMIALDLRPYNCVADRGFVRVLKHTAPSYTIPHRTTFSRNHIPNLYQDIKKKMSAILAEDLKTVKSISFTTDGWRARNGDCFISLTCHYVDQAYVYKCYTLNTLEMKEKHSADNLRQLLEGMMKDWNIPHNDESVTIYIVTDNARNITAAVQNYGENVWRHRQCFGHTLQLAINDAKNSTDGIKNLLKKIRGIVGHYNSSDPARRSLHKKQEEMSIPILELVQDVETRWNSEFAMLKRLLELKEPLTALLADSVHVDNLTGMEWGMVKGLVTILEPLDTATTLSSGIKYPTTSMILPLIKGMMNNLDEFIQNKPTFGVVFARELRKSVKARFPVSTSIMADKTTASAMVLDPRYKTLLLDLEESARVKQFLLEELKKNVQENDTINNDQASLPGTSQGSFWGFLDALKAKQPTAPQAVKTMEAELEQYLTTPTVDHNTVDVHNYWKETGHQLYPNVSKLAQHYMAIPATSVPSERMFSTSGNVVTCRRERLLPAHVQELTFLHDNLPLFIN